MKWDKNPLSSLAEDSNFFFCYCYDKRQKKKNKALVGLSNAV